MKIKASYTGRCRVCNGDIQVGEVVEWDRGLGVTCMKCLEQADTKPVVVSDDLLKGLAAAVEIAQEEEHVQKARQKAQDAMGRAPDLRVGMSYDEALEALTATRKGVGAVAAIEPKVEVKITPVHDPDPESMVVPGVGEVVTVKGLDAARKRVEERYYGPEVKKAEDSIKPAQKPKADGAVESKPLDTDQEDDSWLEMW